MESLSENGLVKLKDLREKVQAIQKSVVALRKYGIGEDFYKKFEWQKIDVVNFLINEEHPFKNLVLDKAIKL